MKRTIRILTSLAIATLVYIIAWVGGCDNLFERGPNAAVALLLFIATLFFAYTFPVWDFPDR